jgi:YHS domain-containing protein
MRIFLRVVLVFFAVYAVLSVVRSLFSPSTTTTPTTKASGGGKLVKDPVCGMYVTEQSSIAAGGNYFCSEECRQKFLAAGA